MPVCVYVIARASKQFQQTHARERMRALLTTHTHT